MQPSRKRAQQRAWDTLLEKGIIAVAIGFTLLISPHILNKGSAIVNSVTAALRPAGWVAVGLGLALIALHILVQRLRRARPAPAEAGASRFQHSVLPEELLNPPTRIRLDPHMDTAPSTEPFETSTIPAELEAEPAAASPERPTPAQDWGPRVWRQIEWRRFELVCEALFKQAGFQTVAQTRGADGGANIWLHSRNAQGPVAVVQCRHWLRKPVGVKELREFHEVMTAHQLQRGTYTTSGRYTQDALEFAHANRIHVLDGAALLALIAKRRPEQQQALLAVAYEGEYWRPTCASCGIKMVERGSTRGATFWGCTAYPHCRNTLQMPRGA
jgi:restriction system protein